MVGEEGLGKKQNQLDTKKPQTHPNRHSWLQKYLKIKGREQDPESANPASQTNQLYSTATMLDSKNHSKN